MTADGRDELWSAVSRTWYLAAYNERFSEEVARRWKIFDDVSKVLVALTASGSAVSGWVLWESPDYKYLWLLLAGAGAVLSIISTALGVPTRVKDWEDSRREFSLLQNDLDTFRDRMRIKPDFDLADFTGEYQEFRRRYGETVQRLKNDVLATRGLKTASQNDLTSKLTREGWSSRKDGQ